MERTDVGMRELGDGPRLALEARLQLRRIAQMDRESLDGDGPAQACVGRPIDFPHAPGPDQCLDSVWAQQRTGSQGFRSPDEDGRVAERSRLSMRIEQLLDLGAQRRIAFARCRDEGGAVRCVPRERRMEDVSDDAPALGSHGREYPL
jgi:hypothetical protein